VQADRQSRSESAIQSDILSYLRHLPQCWAVKYPATFMRGVPDIIGVFHGTFFALEVKRSGERPTPIQDAVMEQIRTAGGIAEVVTNCEEAQSVMERIGVAYYARRLGCAP
jgi:hypothetical protein